ncbi:MAG: DUF86 domain-containing protein [Anaerolineae bacterium]|nr:DUF86 domain-containing protein [Anaerolineae bacterium]
MSDLKKYIADLLQRISYIQDFTQDGIDSFMQDIKTQEAVIRSYEVIGEIVKRIPESVLELYPNVAWKKVKAFRDFLIHNYDQIDLDFVWMAVEDLSNLKAAVESMQRNLEADKSSE